ncbi:ABC transporter B family member 21-like [Salvia miltiorrhiza]|uniref:ABC transporter B family member 21-like n=1 Tax=Salvia miltiorrhiza TaxID=226208 RepID=UPI0025ACCC91|nr:ABC transporter B family member 21-like [Salvia miltiorrhiza]
MYLLRDNTIIASLPTLLCQQVEVAFLNAKPQNPNALSKVASYTGKKRVVSEYNKSLDNAYKSSVHQGLATEIVRQILLIRIWCLYGGRIVRQKFM